MTRNNANAKNISVLSVAIFLAVLGGGIWFVTLLSHMITEAPTSFSPDRTLAITISSILSLTDTPLFGDSSTEVDLETNIISVGYINNEDVFVATDVIPTNARAAVQFSVSNIGTKKISAWDYAATLPANPPYTHTSKTEKKLAPKENRSYTLIFSGDQIGIDGRIEVNVDPQNKVEEIDEENNSASAQVVFDK